MNEETTADLARSFNGHRFAQEIYESTPPPVEIEIHDCRDFAQFKQHDWVETHGLDCGPYEHCHEEWFVCSLCHERIDESDFDAPGRETVLIEAGCTPEEVAAFEKFPVKRERMQGELFPQEVA